MIHLIDLSAWFWRNALGGKDPRQGYDLTIDALLPYRGKRAVLCLDSPRSVRKEKSPEYKSNRPPKPESAILALRSVEARACEWPLPLATVDGWEADDVIATLAEQAWPEEVTIVGSEKDFYSLLQFDHVIGLIGPNGPVGAAQCMTKFGVEPRQMTDWLALAGDAADGIPGCPHCGPGRATTLLRKFETLAAIKAATYDDLVEIDGIGPKTATAIQDWDPEPTLDMVRMRTDLPLSLVEILG